MNNVKYNLLTDPLISIRATNGSTEKVSLPDFYVSAAADRIADFPALRAHQTPAWHMFLVQLAVLATFEAGRELPRSADDWRGALRSLTPSHDNDEPWCLVVADWRLPAFLQPGVEREESRADYKRQIDTPDALDILVTSKNHDLKGERMADADAEDWLYALISLQTMEGFMGAGNYGVMRMNGGFASRPMLRISPNGLGVGGQWLRDVQALLAQMDAWVGLAEALDIGTRSPVHKLLWTVPWDGTTSLSLAHVHPLSVEICRRIRLQSLVHGGIHAIRATSKSARVNAGALKGVVADPWIPIDLRDAKQGAKAFTASSDGFGYRRMVALLDAEQFRPALLQRPTAAEKLKNSSFTLTAAVLTRGQGETEGFHLRQIEWGPGTSLVFASQEKKLVKRAQDFLARASLAAGKVLRPSIIQLIDGSSEPNWKNPVNAALAQPWLTRLDADIDRHFFVELDASFEAQETDEHALARWELVLSGLVRTVFSEASKGLPRKSEGRFLGEARARNLLENALKKHFPSLRRKSEEKEMADVQNG